MKSISRFKINSKNGLESCLPLWSCRSFGHELEDNCWKEVVSEREKDYCYYHQGWDQFHKEEEEQLWKLEAFWVDHPYQKDSLRSFFHHHSFHLYSWFCLVAGSDLQLFYTKKEKKWHTTAPKKLRNPNVGCSIIYIYIMIWSPWAWNVYK